jgi:hypothetical protein
LRDDRGFLLRRHFPRRKVILRRHSKRVRNAIEESEHGGDVNRLGNLIFFPSGVAKFLHVFWRRAIRRLGDLLHIIEQHPLGGSESRFIEFAFDDGLYALIGGSLNPQEVSVAVQSIRALVQIRDVTGNHFLMPP